MRRWLLVSSSLVAGLTPGKIGESLHSRWKGEARIRLPLLISKVSERTPALRHTNYFPRERRIPYLLETARSDSSGSLRDRLEPERWWHLYLTGQSQTESDCPGVALSATPGQPLSSSAAGEVPLAAFT